MRRDGHHIERVLFGDVPNDLWLVRGHVPEREHESTREMGNASLLILQRRRIVPIQRHDGKRPRPALRGTMRVQQDEVLSPRGLESYVPRWDPACAWFPQSTGRLSFPKGLWVWL